MRKISLILLVCVASCQSKPDVQLSIDKKHGIVKVTGLDITTLQGIKRDSITTALLSGKNQMLEIYYPERLIWRFML